MDKNGASAHPDRRRLYAEGAPYEVGRLRVSDGHILYYEQCGRRDGPAVVVLHGGPGGACSPAMRRFFDLSRWRVILFDQRGCGRSTPHASLHANTTWDLVEDMEALRRAVGVERWSLFGGSWGSTLALAYAARHADRIAGVIVRGVFLMTPDEVDWFYGGGAGARLPDAWRRFLAPLNPDERADPIPAYYARLTGDDPAVRARAAIAWTSWESAAIDPSRTRFEMRPPDQRAADALARIECHYFHHGGFLDAPDQLLNAADALADTPGFIVQGGSDLVTPPGAARRLAERWPQAAFQIVDGAGHAASEPGIIDGLVRATDALVDQLAPERSY